VFQLVQLVGQGQRRKQLSGRCDLEWGLFESPNYFEEIGHKTRNIHRIGVICVYVCLRVNALGWVVAWLVDMLGGFEQCADFT